MKLVAYHYINFKFFIHSLKYNQDEKENSDYWRRFTM